MAKITFNNKAGDFYPTLKKRVDEYFTKNNVKKTGNWKLYHKSVILIALFITLYILVVFQYLTPGLSLLACALLGLVSASIGFNVMHDACHGSYSTNDKLNNIMGHSLNALGGTCFLWKQKHNIIHHTYTNVDGVDDDIAKSPTIRQCHTQKWVPAHQIQHLYLPLVYIISSFAWIFIMDFQKYFGQKIYTTPAWKMDFKEHFIFWATKVIYISLFMVIPIYQVGFLPWLAGFWAMHATMGFALGIVFQLAHVVESTHFVEGYEDTKIDEEWAVHQVVTTANFARKSSIINWYVGGLNYQIEHHLFPKMSHVHYPKISQIVIDTCKEFGIQYNDYPTMWSAVKSHFRLMKEFGKRPAVLPVH